MTYDDLLPQRLANQRLTSTRLKNPEDVVRWLGAVQAQEYPSAKWALAERAAGVTDAAMDAAFDAGRILRTHVMRPTWHFVLPSDIRWMLELTAPRVNAGCASYYRKLRLDDAVFARSHAVVAKALRGGKHLTRAELSSALRDGGITSHRDDKLRVIFILLRAELDGVICSGRRIGRQLTYALLEERVPRAPRVSREEARAELARRYFTSHGPATLKDFMWWSGLAAADARAGLESVRSELASDDLDGKLYFRPRQRLRASARHPRAFLLTTWDECLVAYRDRAPDERSRVQPSRDAGQTIVIGGRVAGTWKRTLGKDGAVVTASPFSAFSRSDEDAVAAAAGRYARFLGMPAAVSFHEEGGRG